MKETGDISLDQLESEGKKIYEWIVHYFRNIEEFKVFSPIEPSELRKTLQAPLPKGPEDLGKILDDFQTKVVPYLTHWNHPSFFAYFANTGSGPGILAETLTAALNVNQMLWRTAPAASALEEVVLGWVKEMLGYPSEADGVLMNGASLASLTAMTAALHSIHGLDIRNKGLAGRKLPRLRIYQSDQAHSSIDRAALTLGIGLDNVVKISCDPAYRLRPSLLEKAIVADRARGYLPVFLCGTVGTTSTTSIDPIEEMGEICRRQGLWFHLDAAYAGFAAIIPEVKKRIGDFSVADSLVVNPHKWLFSPMEVTCLFCRRRGALVNTFSLVPEYLQSEQEPVPNFMDYSPQLGRSFRALKLWYVIRSFGLDGLRRRLLEHIRLAKWFADQVDAHPDFERVAPVEFSTVCFRARATQPDQFNKKLLERTNQTGKVFLSHTRLPDGYTLRLAIGNIRTARRHVEAAWKVIQKEAKTLRGQLPAHN